MSEPSTPKLPLVEKIALAIQAKLKAITRENDYQVDVSEVVRPNRLGSQWTPKHMGIEMLQGKPTMTGSAVGNPPVVEWVWPILLDLVVRVSEASETALDTVINVFMADVVQAMLSDVQWHTVPAEGGTAVPLAIDTRLADVEYPPPISGIEGMTLTFDLTFRTAENNPYVQM
jgi:hypothetical protein